MQIPDPINSPLFRMAAKVIRTEALREFRTSDFGRLASIASKSPRDSRGLMGEARRFAQSGGEFVPAKVFQRLAGANFGKLAQEIRKYSRGGGAVKKFIDKFLSSLGPAGDLLRAVADPSSRSASGALKAATGVIRAFGGEALPGKHATTEEINRGIAASWKFLTENRYQVIPPADAPPVAGRGRLPFDAETATRGGVTKARVPWNNDKTRFRNLPVDHPIITGAFVANFQSSNVHSFGYDIENRFLYVRFWAKKDGQKAGPGPLYRYSTVPPATALTLYTASVSGSSIGEWVWDHLRERGTVSGHQYPYELVGIMGGYVPRRATLTARGEEYKLRTVHVGGGHWLSSQLPNELVRTVTFGRGEPRPPNNGRPGNGRPGNGRPRR